LVTHKVVVNHPLNWENIDLSESVKTFYFEVDDDNNVKAQPVFLFDPTFDPSAIGGHVKAINTAGAVQNVGSIYPGANSFPNAYALQVGALTYFYNQVTGYQVVEPVITHQRFAACTSVAATDVWTPAGGKSIWLMGGVIVMHGGLAAAGVERINIIQETLGDIGVNFQCWAPIAASVGTNVVIPFNLQPGGYKLTVADKKLQVTLGAACTAGAVSVTVWGTEF